MREISVAQNYMITDPRQNHYSSDWVLFYNF
jgi:hypothetical protein